MYRRLASTFVATALVASPVVFAAPAQAARCVSGAEVRGQVAAFVHSLRDDVVSPTALKAVRGALVESVKTARGAHADTPHESRGLGKEISALARQLHTTDDPVERAALKAQIHALQEQKRADHFSERDARRAEHDLIKLERRLEHATDSRGEGRQVAAFVHALMAQFNC